MVVLFQGYQGWGTSPGQTSYAGYGAAGAGAGPGNYQGWGAPPGPQAPPHAPAWPASNNYTQHTQPPAQGYTSYGDCTLSLLTYPPTLPLSSSRLPAVG